MLDRTTKECILTLNENHYQLAYQIANIPCINLNNACKVPIDSNASSLTYRLSSPFLRQSIEFGLERAYKRMDLKLLIDLHIEFH